MIRLGALSSLVVACAIGFGGFSAAAQTVPNPSQAEASSAEQDTQVLPAGCVAIAVDPAAGGEGNGTGTTLEAAEADAIAQCKASGGKTCTIETSSCNPDG